MRILFFSPYFDDRIGDPEASLERFPILSELPKAMQARGHQVRVLGLGTINAAIERNRVRYQWIAPSVPIQAISKLAHRLKPHYGPAYYQPSLALARRAHSLQPDVIHVFGLTMDLQLLILRFAGSRGATTVVHYHGGSPPTGRLRQFVQRAATRHISTALFTSLAQADDWIHSSMLRSSQVKQVLETSSPYSGLPRDEARKRTGMTGAPIYLSAGRLHPIKDPMTMLRGFDVISRRQPEAKLYLYYLTDELLDEMTGFVEARPDLHDRVKFRGRAEPQEMEAIYSSADVLLQASVREWSGLAVLEAMSCGCIPVVTDIPSFSAMTGNGTVGKLFRIGDSDGLADAARSIGDVKAESAAVRDHFRQELSFSAMAAQLERIYLDAGSDA